MIAVRRSLLLIVLAGLGTLAGIWIAISPWALGLTRVGAGWSALTSGSFWSGVVLAAGSLTCLAALSTTAVRTALRLAPPSEDAAE
ncbi:MAG TPA: hypothetical protein VIA06_10000 [Candidatus Dormibacteraeota bacterium]|jgi:hypothetical protein|nr:hypothetical protein [Candidatus Dormibacteraeota bacterium]